MTDKKQTRSELVTAAEDFDRELAEFSRLAEAARRCPLDSQKNLQRATATFTEIGQSEQRLGTASQGLLRAIQAAQVKQQEQAEMLRARAEEIRERTERAGALLGRFASLGEEAGQINAHMREITQKKRGTNGSGLVSTADDPDFTAGLSGVLERLGQLAATARDLMDSAHEAGFDDIARLVEGLRHQILSARSKLSTAYDMKVPKTPRSS